MVATNPVQSNGDIKRRIHTKAKKPSIKNKYGCCLQYELIDRDDSYLGESATCYIARFAEKNC